jgi:hypothetical protein
MTLRRLKQLFYWNGMKTLKSCTNVIFVSAKPDHITEKEVYEGIMQMEKNNGPTPYGFQAEIYPFFWDVVKKYFMAMFFFFAFHRGDLPLFYLRLGTIIILPKKENVVQIQQYCPICLLNVSIKIFT